MSAAEAMQNGKADPTPFDYQVDVFQKGLQFQRPPITFDTTQWEPKAKKVMSENSRNYVSGNAGTGSSDENNRAAFRKWGFVPNRLTGAKEFPDLSVTLFGKKYPFPVAICPVGVQKIFHPDGEWATAAAANKEHVPYIFSSASATSIEDVAKANGDGPRWFQLYWPDMAHSEVTKSLLSRAQSHGYDVLAVNVDTFIMGWRPCDMDDGYSPFLRPDHVGTEMGFTDPVYRKIFKDKHGKEVEEDLATASAEWSQIFIPGKPHGWKDLQFLREHWKGPIVVKGIQSVADAEACIAAGMDGIYVSNHGGRQVDAGVSSLDMLAEIAEAVGDRTEIIFDSGVRNGLDVAKALALGAKMVAIGRPFVYGLALEGETGVRHVIRSILGELDLSLHLTGISSVQPDQLNRKVLRRV